MAHSSLIFYPSSTIDTGISSAKSVVPLLPRSTDDTSYGSTSGGTSPVTVAVVIGVIVLFSLLILCCVLSTQHRTKKLEQELEEYPDDPELQYEYLNHRYGYTREDLHEIEMAMKDLRSAQMANQPWSQGERVTDASTYIAERFGERLGRRKWTNYDGDGNYTGRVDMEGIGMAIRLVDAQKNIRTLGAQIQTSSGLPQEPAPLYMKGQMDR
jgi:hypothetical protein